MTRFEVRPLGPWGRPITKDRRTSATFRAPWNDTVTMLKAEAYALGAVLVVVQIDAQADQIRRDGMLKATAKVEFPGVKVSFGSRHGPLAYATDVYEHQHAGAMPGWQANVRAIALGLVALRSVDRYGITRSGEQYRGWTALSDKPFAHEATMSRATAEAVLLDAAGIPDQALKTPEAIQTAYRKAVLVHHDAYGTRDAFQAITKARGVLLASLRS